MAEQIDPKFGSIGNGLKSVAPDHVVAEAADIYDKTLGKYQSELNQQIGSGGGEVTVDDALSDESTNPVQNKVVKEAIDARVPSSRKVNGKSLTADITLNANDVGALPSSTPIPAAVTVDGALSDTSTNPVQNKAVKAAVDAKYSKPSSGIPKDDLSSGVKDALNLAETALQAHQDVTSKADKSDTYTKEEVNNLLVNAPETSIVVIENASGADPVSLLPQTPAANTIYRVPNADGESFGEYEWNGTKYIKLADRKCGIDDKPYKRSSGLVVSEGIYDAVNAVSRTVSTEEEWRPLTPYEVMSGKFFYDGTVRSNSNFTINVYEVEPNGEYLFTATFGSNTQIYFVTWLDASKKVLLTEDYKGSDTQYVTYTNELVVAPKNAKYLYLNTAPTKGSASLKKVVRHPIKSSDLKKEADATYTALSLPEEIMTPSKTTGSFIASDGSVKTNSGTEYWVYQVEGGKAYTFSGSFTTGYSDIYIVNWFNSDSAFIGGYYYKVGGVYTRCVDEPVVAPADAAYLYLNVSADTQSISGVKKAPVMDGKKVYSMCVNSSVLSKEVSALTDKNTLKAESVRNNGFYDSLNFVTNNYIDVYIYSVDPNKAYTFSSKTGSAVDMYLVTWADENRMPILQDGYKGTIGQEVVYEDQPLVCPYNARYVYINVQRDYAHYHRFCEAHIDKSKYDGMFNAVTDTKRTPYALAGSESGAFWHTDGVRSNSSFTIRKYAVTPGNKYYFSTRFSASVNIYAVAWYNSSDSMVSYENYAGSLSSETTFTDVEVTAPSGAAYLWLNTQNSEGYYGLNDVTKEFLNVKEIAAKAGAVSKDTKVVISSVGYDSASFYVRARYNSEKDIILQYYTNGNSLISPNCAYIGQNTLEDSDIMTSANIVSSHNDSTAPFLHFTQYWHLYAQHGYPVPYFANNTSLTTADVGSEWKDQLDRRYKIGKVTSSYVWLLPVIYKDSKGHYVRDWRNTTYSTTISSLTHVSGATHTGSISVSALYQEQLRPVMRHEDRTFYADGVRIESAGTYYCDEFKVSELQIGYDPATISSWFPVNLDGASEMARFTWSYNFKGAQCCVNTTLSVKRELECNSYGATQQQFFLDKGDYKAMFMIPKAASRNGVALDKPFNSPSTSSPSYVIYRTTSHLKDVNDPVDREIGFLYNQSSGEYLVGMAAGLSLVSGDTVTSKRIQNCPVGDDNFHYMLLNFSPSNTNKFYVAAINTAPFESNDYYLPTTYFKEINYYVSYFDPAENVGQVYWYKDGSRYVIYCHCQSAYDRLAINVPVFMEGLKLSVVEKTSGTDLLTDTIQNGKFFVNYNTADANYIVLKAE